MITYTILGGSFKGFLKGVYKGCIIGFYIRGPSIVDYTVLGLPYYMYSITGPGTLF